ncbi:MAG: DUF4214 domain-containing protein [Pseudomonadota bacterium]
MAIAASLTEADLRREGAGIVIAGNTFGAFEFPDDEDYFLFAPEPNRIYSFSVDSQVDTELGLFTAPGLELIQADDDSGPGEAPTILLQTNDTPRVVLIEVDTPGTREPGGDGPAGPLADYVLQIAEIDQVDAAETPDPDPAGNTIETSAQIGVGTAIAGTIDPTADIDAYAVYLEADRQYIFDLEAVDGIDTFLELFDDQGTPIDADNDGGSGTNAQLTVVVDTPGFYFVVASEAEFSDTGAYVLSATNFGAALPPGGPDQVGADADSFRLIEIGVPVAGRIETEQDLDLYAVVLTEGSEYLLGGLGYGGFDGAMILRDDTGAVLRVVDNPNGQIDPLTTYAATYSGVHFLEMGGSTETETGSFDIAAFLLDGAAALASEARDIALIYEAGLNRAADEPGLNFWINAFEGGFTLRQISQAFLDSVEFENSIGDPDVISDFDLVTGLYENVLDRAADDPGRDFWLSVLDQPDVDAADLLIAFARSTENRVNSETIEDLVYNDVTEAWAFETLIV